MKKSTIEIKDRMDEQATIILNGAIIHYRFLLKLNLEEDQISAVKEIINYLENVKGNLKQFYDEFQFNWEAFEHEIIKFLKEYNSVPFVSMKYNFGEGRKGSFGIESHS